MMDLDDDFISLSSNEDDTINIEQISDSYSLQNLSHLEHQLPSSSRTTQIDVPTSRLSQTISTKTTNLINLPAPTTSSLSASSSSTGTNPRKRKHSDEVRQTSCEYLVSVYPEKPSLDVLLSKIEEENLCCICTEPLTLENNHHIVTLKCGHIFGKSCIEEWLRPALKHLRCPTCNHKASKKDIIKIYSKCVRPSDTGELVNLNNRISILEKQNIELQVRTNNLESINNKLMFEIDSYKLQIMSLKNESSRKDFSRFLPSLRAKHDEVIQIETPAFDLNFIKDFPIRDANARLHAFHSLGERLVVSTHSPSNPLFTNLNHGIRKISIESGNFEVLNIHDKIIKDLFVDQLQNTAVTVSSDKTLKISSLLANQEISNVMFDKEPCSVHVDSQRFPDYIYVGLKNGDLVIYDRRQISIPVDTITPINKTPLISIASLTGYANTQKRDSLILTVQLSSAQLYYFESPDAIDPEMGNTYRYYKVPYDGKLSNASYDYQSNRIMVSARCSQKHVNHTHFVFKYDSDFNQPTNCTKLQGGRNTTLMTRSKLFSHPEHHDFVIAGAGDQQAKGARFWNVDSQVDKIDVETYDNVRDIDFINLNNRPLVSCLTEKVVKLYNLK